MAGSLLRAGALRPQNQAPRRKLNMNFEEKEEKPYVSAEAPIQPVNQEEPKQEIKTPENPPEDWLEPKIYKGSTNF